MKKALFIVVILIVIVSICPALLVISAELLIWGIGTLIEIVKEII